MPATASCHSDGGIGAVRPAVGKVDTAIPAVDKSEAAGLKVNVRPYRYRPVGADARLLLRRRTVHRSAGTGGYRDESVPARATRGNTEGPPSEREARK